MAPGKLQPNDPRVEHHTVDISGNRYHYLLGHPSSFAATGTILLVHGWPDLSLGWRYQVPALMSLGLRVIVPDMLGYGRSGAPEALSAYSLKNMAADMVALAAHVTGSPDEPIILCGHDWGGALVWRIALWHPRRIRAVISVCTPYRPPSAYYYPPEQVVQMIPNFRYQLQLAGPDVQAGVVGKDKLRSFLNGMYGGRGPQGELPFSAADGVLLENLDKIGKSPLMSEEEVEFYVEEYARNGMRGPLNWYRTSKINYDEERELFEGGKSRIEVPSLMISASHDSALPPSMTAGMEAHFDTLVKKEVNSHHWALWAAAGEVNELMAEFLKGVLAGNEFKASI